MFQAKKHKMSFTFGKASTVPFEIVVSSHSTKIIRKTAKEGLGLLSGGVVRSVLEALGIINVCCKVHGSRHRNYHLVSSYCF